MSFWDFFQKNLGQNQGDTSSQKYSRLHDKIVQHLPQQASEKDQVLTVCLAGLLARIAYLDLKIEQAEKAYMKKILKDFTDLDDQTIQSTVELASDEIEDLAGEENHLYCYPLNDLLETEEKYHILEALFAFAASDGNADNQESEEIRVISKSLLLEHKHYVAAKATVKEYLGALK